MNKRQLSMKKIRQILRMKYQHKNSHSEIARNVNVSSSTVHDCIIRAKQANLTWPIPEDLDDEQLENLLYPVRNRIAPAERGEIDWHRNHKELQRKGVTLRLLWIEYRSSYASGYSYSRFCENYVSKLV